MLLEYLCVWGGVDTKRGKKRGDDRPYVARVAMILL